MQIKYRGYNAGNFRFSKSDPRRIVPSQRKGKGAFYRIYQGNQNNNSDQAFR